MATHGLFDNLIGTIGRDRNGTGALSRIVQSGDDLNPNGLSPPFGLIAPE